MVAQGLSRLLEQAADLIGTVNDGGQLVETARRLRPDVIVADMTMPVMSGLDAMRRLKAEGVQSKFIFLTVHAEPQMASEALREGASAYLLKQAAGNELIEALKAVVAGRTYLTPLITKDVLWSLAQQGGDDPSRLTPRQRDVLRQIADGKRMKEIAADLNISVRTVENHKYAMMQILGIENTADLIRFAIKQGLVDS
jgi:DNA-binding NarL/FixJ family response regulator